MQSISAPSIHIHPVQSFDIQDVQDANDGDYDVLHLDKLLNKIFGDELEKALAEESEGQSASNLIEFPLVHELVLQYETAPQPERETLDFSPSTFDLNDPVLETDLTRFTPSIIERDDADSGHLQSVIDAQQEQLVGLRSDLKLKDMVIRAQAVDMASKDDQLKYMPELFIKALQLANVEATNLLLSKDLEVERLVNEELNSELVKTTTELAAINSHILVKFARVLGVIV